MNILEVDKINPCCLPSFLWMIFIRGHAKADDRSDAAQCPSESGRGRVCCASALRPGAAPSS